MGNPMDCRDIKSLVDRWEKGIDLNSIEKKSFSSHLNSCATCRNHYRTLLPFLLEEGKETIYSEPVPDIATSVLAKIQRLERARPEKVAHPGFLSNLTETIFFSLSTVWFRLRRFIPAFALGLILLIGGSIFWSLTSGQFGRMASDEVTVRFMLEHVNARSVSVVGDFSNWKSYPLQKVGDRWEIQIKLKKGRVYTYNFVVDGEHWVPDPKVPFRVEDGFGGEATLLQL
ncbi:MAG: isoamylase early set domain-containing protein [Spirochaetes bacterium]|nr:isoamylase early set domain-containing protein [Spirochaetota bacterium]